jgi:hypothetical protein
MGPSVRAQGYPQATQDGLRAGSGQLSRAQDCAGLHSHSSVKGSAGVSFV